MAQDIPAIMVGGPPHSGKSVLTYALTRLLRAQRVDHYVLRACPDGEGDWSQEADQSLVRLVRLKGAFTPDYVASVSQAIADRHIPLIVDVGGKPLPWQAAIPASCTHAILLAQNDDQLQAWRSLSQQHGLAILAEFISSLAEPEELWSETPILRGRVAGLERGATIASPLCSLLANRIAQLFVQFGPLLRRRHLATAPAAAVIAVDAALLDLGLATDARNWLPGDLPHFLALLPRAQSLALYGRGPNWLYAAAACHVGRDLFWQFDPRLGWVQPAQIITGHQPGASALQIVVAKHAGYESVSVSIPSKWLDYEYGTQITAPLLSARQGVVFSGALPLWLLTGLCLAYNRAPWLAICQPQLPGSAVIVSSQIPSPQVGDLVPVNIAQLEQ